MARLAITSLAFMFDDVPDPVWKTSTGKWSSHLPVGHLGRGRRDGHRHRRLDHAQAPVDDRRRPLDPPQGARSARGRCPGRRWGSSPPPAGSGRPSGPRRAHRPRPSSRVPAGRPWGGLLHPLSPGVRVRPNRAPGEVRLMTPRYRRRLGVIVGFALCSPCWAASSRRRRPHRRQAGRSGPPAGRDREAGRAGQHPGRAVQRGPAEGGRGRRSPSPRSRPTSTGPTSASSWPRPAWPRPPSSPTSTAAAARC